MGNTDKVEACTVQGFCAQPDIMGYTAEPQAPRLLKHGRQMEGPSTGQVYTYSLDSFYHFQLSKEISPNWGLNPRPLV